MENITIRRMTIEDAEAVTDILMNAWKTAYRGIVSDEYLDNMNRETLAERRRQQHKDYIVAVADGRIVGYCWYMNNNSYTQDVPEVDSEIVALYVDPASKRHGLGKMLLSHAMDDLRNQGKKKMIIWCLKDNLPARAFYEKMGGTVAYEHKTNIWYRDYDEVGFLYNLEQ